MKIIYIDGATVLMEKSYNGHTDIVNALLNNGVEASIDEENENDDTSFAGKIDGDLIKVLFRAFKLSSMQKERKNYLNEMPF